MTTTITVATLPSFRAAYTTAAAPAFLARFTDADALSFRGGLSFRAAL